MSAIPYTVERRPDTGVNNVTLGMWLFLASETMLFAGLFSAYFMLRAGAVEPWLPFRDHLWSAARATLLLIATSAFFARAVLSARAAGVTPRPSGLTAFRMALFTSVILALAFCAVKADEYSGLFEQQLGPATNTHLATYFLLTGVHLLHVVGGILVNVWLMLTPARTWTSAAPAVINRLEAAALYWYFIDVVWLVILVLLYVV